MSPSPGRARRTQPPARPGAPPGDQPDVVSAGAVVFGPRRRVLLVHRPKYDDWSFPKGKLEPGEHPVVAAVREIEEETGLRVRLGPPLADQHYPVTAGRKTVHYWRARPTGDHDVSGYRPNAEIDGVRWVEASRAARMLTHPHDVRTLDEAQAVPRKIRTVVVLRHGVARARKTWRGSDDRVRPLLAAGRRQAGALVPLLGAYGIRRVISSSSTRCVETVAPYAVSEHLDLEPVDALSEEDATPDGVRRLVHEVVDQQRREGRARRGVVLCSHRPVLPWIFDALGAPDPGLEKGEMVVLHLTPDGFVACEL